MALLRVPLPAGRIIDWVVSNPPYVPSVDLASLDPEFRDQEPQLALDGGPDGPDVVRAILSEAALRARVGWPSRSARARPQRGGRWWRAPASPACRCTADPAGVERGVIGQRAPGGAG